LDSLADQTLPKEQFGVLVIDDGSTDGTDEQVRQWQHDHADIACRLIRQPPMGLASARNTGLENADAPILAYLDDDALAHPDWLEGIVTAFQEFPTAGAVGGQVRVRWVRAGPGWWTDELDEVFNRFQPSDAPALLDFPQLPYGCNFAVRREVAVRAGGFRTDLGRRDGALLGGEETDLFLRLLEAGHPIAYWPAAVVEHLALPARANRWYVLKRAWNHGRSLARIAAVHPRVAQRMPALPRCVWRMVRYAPAHRFRLVHWKYWLLRFGYHYECRTLHRSPDSAGSSRILGTEGAVRV